MIKGKSNLKNISCDQATRVCGVGVGVRETKRGERERGVQAQTVFSGEGGNVQSARGGGVDTSDPLERCSGRAGNSDALGSEFTRTPICPERTGSSDDARAERGTCKRQRGSTSERGKEAKR